MKKIGWEEIDECVWLMIEAEEKAVEQGENNGNQ